MKPALTWRRRSATSEQRPLLVIGGPTATGKTALAVALARRWGGEIVGADARQVYRGLDVATGKATAEELQGVPHHLLDVVEPDTSFTLTEYAALAVAAIAAIHTRGRLPLLVGGTGLYIRAVTDGLRPPAAPPDPVLRAELERLWQEDRPALLAELARRDPITAGRVDQRNPRRVIRALEVIRTTGEPFSAQLRQAPPPYALTMLALSAERSTLHALADRRVAAMIERGLVEETRRLLVAGYDFSRPAFSAVGYREMAAVLGGELTLDEGRRRIAQATHAYQRRQLTWFRADRRFRWLDATAPDLVTQADAIGISDALSPGDESR